MKNKRTLADLSQGTNNNLNLVRLIAALMVMYMHSFALCQANLEADIMYTLSFHKALSGQVGVDIFFVISGFLIYRSYERSGDVVKYIRARFLRIWPLLALFILVTAFIFGPIYTSLSMKEYFAGDIKGYLMNLVFNSSQTSLPGVFANHINRSSNGSIWTLQYEVLCYLLVIVLFPFLKKCNKLIFLLVAFSGGVYLYFNYLWTDATVFILSKDVLVNLGRLTMHFEMGVLYYIYRERIVLRYRYFWLKVVAFIVGSYFLDYEIVFALFGTYILMCIGFSYWKISEYYNKVGDISYGVYIMSFFVQQRVIEYLGEIPYGYRAYYMDTYLNFVVSVLVVVPLAFISWHCFEKQLLKLK
ncbi:Peptidoglycan/LPS O-acetylase OafA/YrhL, contains acyltransferase and SGNH-hydrolase domains [Pseudobutyrivibrio sp. 49]|uniref:acyltransferase family protein n=1 Tax=unclassified Pseudobutyrivibrio TaxID=2638619 RepID=UPI00088F7FFF|nr:MULTISPECIES: acyltransferase [unclassified Pseudobutyrivibrio]SDH56712.1 Peptidoglycan/LPS O-acetylase OafA/YrhL, contains acyltransferase and SGNH-hydrolase domains [Pseudobutyrivibrio sp. 49]SFO27290.1 Peptidoglycan/LPS O-acetylase OafA/YrhL, contains acyltransferase and SGNH-hydrolase domains [Pseudobutyrivibrio sp. UC1225]